MDPQATPFPGKVRSMKSKTNRESSEAPKTKSKEPLTHREKRVFGTVRNTNVAVKTVSEKPRTKPLSGKLTKPAINDSETPKKSSVISNGKTKKSVNFQGNLGENKDKLLKEGDISVPQTPLRSPFLVKPRAPGTPYLSAERCSKCRFDKLETSSYWLAQIKLAESVGKHFVSAAFFRMASECRAEPFRNVKVELKKYLARHEHLSAEKEWKDLSVGYGLLKDESCACQENGEEGTNAETRDQDQEEKTTTEEAVRPYEEKEAQIDSFRPKYHSEKRGSLFLTAQNQETWKS